MYISNCVNPVLTSPEFLYSRASVSRIRYQPNGWFVSDVSWRFAFVDGKVLVSPYVTGTF